MKLHVSKRTSALALGVLLGAVTGFVGYGRAQRGFHGHAKQWPMGGQNLHDTRNQAFEFFIGPDNVSSLTPKWIFDTGSATATNFAVGAPGDVSATPAVVGGAVYFPTWGGMLFKLDAETGHVIWARSISDYTGIANDISRSSPAVAGDRVFIGDLGGNFLLEGKPGHGARMIAVDAHSGNALWVVTVESHPAAVITGSPVVFRNRVYVGVSSQEEFAAASSAYPCCTFRGSMVALDARDGHLIWKTYTIPDALYTATPSSPGGYTGAPVWSTTPVVDPRRGLVYASTGNNYTVPDSVESCEAASSKPGFDASCVDPRDWFDSEIAFDLDTGQIRWARHTQPYDAWTVACGALPPGTVQSSPIPNCPKVVGPDYDLDGAGPNLITSFSPREESGDDSHARGDKDRSTPPEPSLAILGAGQKSGVYWAFDPANGNILWHTKLGPGSPLGGIEWGSATDGRRIYVAISNLFRQSYTLEPSGEPANGGSWGALDAKSGRILWQTAVPGGFMALGAVSVANGVVYGGSMNPSASEPTMFALDAATGNILWSYPAGGSVNAAPAIVGDTLYWGSGYARFNVDTGGTGTGKFYAFSVPHPWDHHGDHDDRDDSEHR